MTLQALAKCRARYAQDAVGRVGFAWILTWLVLAVDAIWLLLGSWTISMIGVATTLLAVAVFHAPLAFRRYRHDPLIRPMAKTASLLLVFMAASGPLSYLVVSTNAPLIDATLAAWDRALGFDWPRFAAYLQAHPGLAWPLHAIYLSGMPQIIFVLLFLGLTARIEQLESFMRLCVFSAIVTVLLSGLLPAAGAGKYFAAIASMPDVASLSHFEPLRDGRMRYIPLERMQGLISFPSLHAAYAVLLVHAMRGTIMLPTFIALDTAMIVSTPVFGGHYLVDVLAGALLACALITLDRRRSADARAMPAPPRLQASLR